MNTFGHWTDTEVELHNTKVAQMKTAKAHNLAAGAGEVELNETLAPQGRRVDCPAAEHRCRRSPGVPFSVGPTTDEAKLNKTERAFLNELRSREPAIVIGIQNVTLKLGDDCRYTPDFWSVSTSSGAFTFYEVKGFWRDDARVKIKVAARMFSWARFIAVQRVKGQWKFEDIKP